jgi:AraC-type DNA-binding domain-containing proteins
MAQHLFYLISNASIVIFFTLGLIFLVIPLPKDQWLKNYRISTRILSSLFIIMGLFSVIMRWFHLAINVVEIVPFSSLLISTIQVQLFSITLITLINPEYAQLRSICKQAMPILIFTVLYLISRTLFGDPLVFSYSEFRLYLLHPTFVVRVLFFLFFLVQVISYVFSFFREMRIYKREIADFYSETHKLQLDWVKYALLSALVLTILAITYFFYFNVVFHTLFIVLYTSFYFAFALNYLRYTSFYKMIKPAIEMAKNDSEIRIDKETHNTWPIIKEKILSRKSYLRSGITIEELAMELKINRKQLSAFINSEEKVNFNTWINKLRIEEAKQMLIFSPETTLAEISEKTGFTEQSNFSRQFKLVVNVSPSIWRLNNIRETKSSF